MSALRPYRLLALAIPVLVLGTTVRAQELTVLPAGEAIRVPSPSASDAESTTPRRLDEVVARPLDPLDRLVDRAIEDTKARLLPSNVNTPWQIAHGVLALRQDYRILVDGKPASALEWISTNPTFRGRKWWLKTRWGGKGQPFTEPYHFEGHPNQFLAFFGTAGLKEDFEFHVDGKTITIADMIRNAKKETNGREEITWTLWALSSYLPPDARWMSQDQRAWSMEKLVRIQIESPVTKSACGGTHGLFAVANALNAYEKTGQPKRGVWLEADMHLKRYVTAAKSMQNTDGSFSSKYFKGREWSRDPDKRISTTGHTLEFLMNALPESRLNEDWVRKAVKRVATDLSQYRNRALEPGGMYHACDALVIYRQRTRPEFAPREEEPVPVPVVATEPKPIPMPEPVVAAKPESKPESVEAVDDVPEYDKRPITVPMVASKPSNEVSKTEDGEDPNWSPTKPLKVVKQTKDESKPKPSPAPRGLFDEIPSPDSPGFELPLPADEP